MSYIKNMIQDIIEAYESGFNVYDLAERFNLSEETVVEIIQDYSEDL
jgi:Mor family transcriptional regulator